MRKIVRLAAGEHIDMLETPDGLDPRFRVRLKEVVRAWHMPRTSRCRSAALE